MSFDDDFLLMDEEPPRVPDNATSLHSYRLREAALARLRDVDMVQNRKDIQEARELGDLSENFEYESAKNKERQLISRQSTMQSELANMTIFDFATLDPTDVAGVGTEVSFEYEEGRDKGRNRTISILGAWDFDEALGIISSQTRLASAFKGCRVGDETYVPDPDIDGGRLLVKVVSVKPLSKAVIDWSLAE